MSTRNPDKTADSPLRPPSLRCDRKGRVDSESLADVIQWFLDYDERTAVIKHRNVEELFQWKQAEDRRTNENLYTFNRA